MCRLVIYLLQICFSSNLEQSRQHDCIFIMFQYTHIVFGQWVSCPVRAKLSKLAAGSSFVFRPQT